MKKEVLLKTDFKDLKLFRRGKVRDVYDLEDRLLIVSTDRISCFDVVLPSGIPYKGDVLTAISIFWFDFLKDIIPNHFLTGDVNEYPDSLKKYSDILNGRSMVVKKSFPLSVECIVRGYLSGSGWKDYLKTGSVCGIKLPSGLKQSDKLPEIIFTPSTKAEAGHDINITTTAVEQSLGKETTEQIKQASVQIYKKAGEYADKQGIIIADTKFEFGLNDNQIILIDEVLTPDSSRFWPKDSYNPGVAQLSFDKQFVRDYLETLDWDKTPPAPQLPEEIIEKTSQKYKEAALTLTGKKL